VVAVTGECPSDTEGASPFVVYEMKQHAVTGADGRYILTGLSSNAIYNLGAFNQSESVAQEEWGKLVVTPAASKLGIRPEAGRVLGGIDFRLPQNPYVTISGQITDENSGKPITEIIIGGSISQPYQYLGATTPDASGAYKYVFTLSDTTQVNISGSYRNQLAATEAQLKRADTRQPLAPLTLKPGEEMTLDLVVTQPMSIPVRVVDADGRPLENAQVGIGGIMGGTEHTASRCIPTDADGRCVFEGMAPSFQYFVFVQGFTEDQSADLPGYAARSKLITVNAGEPVPEVVLVVENQGGIEGTLVMPDGQPLARAEVTLTANHEGRIEKQEFITDANGQFCVVRALPAATYSPITLQITLNDEAYQANLPETTIEGGNILQLGTIPVSAVAGSK
jgi:hypothetical protein